MTRMVREPSPQFQKQNSFSPVAEGAVLCFAVLRIWVKYSDSGSQAKFATSRKGHWCSVYHLMLPLHSA